MTPDIDGGCNMNFSTTYTTYSFYIMMISSSNPRRIWHSSHYKIFLRIVIRMWNYLNSSNHL